MKKEIKMAYGIEIVKPWSTAMYDHNEQVAEVVKERVSDMWRTALSQLEESLELQDEEGYEITMLDLDWNVAFTDPLLEIQRAVTVYSFGIGYSIKMVAERVEHELENAPTYRLKEIAEDLGLKLEKEFIGFN
jgi:hypothetical protein